MSKNQYKNIYYYNHFKWLKFLTNAKESSILDFFNMQRNLIKGNYRQYLFRKTRRELFKINEADMVLSLRRIKKKRKKRKISIRLLNQQRALKHYYNFKFKYQFKKIYKAALKKNRNIYLNFFLSLEKRIDSTLVRSNLCLSNIEAQQLIKHKKILVNGKLIKNYNYILTSEDTLSILKEYRNIYINTLKQRIRNNLVIMGVPRYLELNYKILTLIFITKNFSVNYLPFINKFNFEVKDIGYSLKL